MFFSVLDMSVTKLTRIKKRDGSIAKFDPKKITEAVWKAISATGGNDRKIAGTLSGQVINILSSQLKPHDIPTVEQLQDIVEKVLIESGHAKVAKAYILYRQRRADLRKEKTMVLEKEFTDEVDKNFDVNALRVLKARYLRKDEAGKLIETPKQLFTRIALNVTIPNLFYDTKVFDKKSKQKIHPEENFDPVKFEGKIGIGKYKFNRYHIGAVKRLYDRFNNQKQMKVSWIQFFDMLKSGKLDNHEKEMEQFFDVMVSKKFIPNTPAIVNFGGPLGLGSACFVLDIEDSLDSIMGTLSNAAKIFQAGGGLGYNFSKLRPEGDYISTTSGKSSGPLSFMSLFDNMTNVIKQGGVRRGANMGIINSNHPDVEKFIKSKAGNKGLRNFNISVLIMPDFWEHYEKNTPYPLTNPRTGKIVKYVNPRVLFDMIVYQAWESAEPGVIFYDHVNKYNPFFEHLGPIVTTNPCVAADTLISTGKGLERIDSLISENIIVDRRTNSGNLMQLGTQLVKPLQRIKTGIKDAYKLTTKSGYELVATAEHKIMTSTGWKELINLTKQDRIFLQSGFGKFNDNYNLHSPVENVYRGKNGRKWTFNLPTQWTTELGLLLGWLVGDGFISEKYNTIGLVFAPEDIEAQKIIQPIFEKYCNRKIKPRYYENNCVQIRSNSKYIVDFFLKLGYNPSEREVPKTLFTAPRDIVIAFLNGLFSSDGTVAMGSESRNYIRLNSSSIKLLKDIQMLLLNLGIRSNIYNRSTKPKIFFYKAKSGESKTYKTSGKNYELNISKENLSKFIRIVGFLQEKNKQKVEALTRFEFYHEYFTDEVQSIEYVGKREVWDITEPTTHSFIANGIVVHNCGEVLLYPYESCNLGSINVWSFAKKVNGKTVVDWDALAKTIQTCTRFLDNVIDVNKYPLKEIEDMTLATRKIGLGVMGIADMLFELGLSYNSDEGRKFMEELMEFVNFWSKIESIELAKERGPMLYYNKSFYPKGRLPFAGFDDKNSWHFDWNKISQAIKIYGIRNGYTTVIAPTGSISMIAGCSSGIEPTYTLVFEKHVPIGSFFYVEPVFERVMQEMGLYDDDLMRDIAVNKGSIQNVAYIPQKLKRTFVTAMDILPEDHIRSLAAFQKWVDSSISKTNNFPANATVEHMKKSYLLAYKLGCKDVTVFRDTSIQGQVLVAPGEKKTERKEEAAPLAPIQPAIPAKPGEISYKLLTNCPECNTSLSHGEGCVSCPECGWGICT